MPGHRTREGAHERIDEGLAAIEEALERKLTYLRDRLANITMPLSAADAAQVAGLIAVRDNPEVARVLHAAIERDPVRGESDPFTDDRRAAA